MQIQPFRMPFFDTARRPSTEDGYFKMIQSRFIPNFQPLSISSVILGINIIVFIVIHIAFSPPSYEVFLKFPTEMGDWALNVEKVKTNRVYLYQTITAMFMHESYLHLIGNMVFGVFVMYQMEYASKCSIFLGLLAGIVANCFAIFTYEGRLLGFSGVLASYVGMIMSLIFTHCTYLQNRFQGSFCMIVVMMIFLSLMVIGLGPALLIHLYGYLLGILLGVAFLPKHMETDLSPLCDKIMKAVAIGVCIAIIAVAIIV